MEDLPASNDTPPPDNSAPGNLWEDLPPPLPALGILSGLSDGSLATLAAYGRYELFPAETLIIRECDPQDRFYVVVSGKLLVSATAAGREIPLSVAEAGECLGEVSVLEPGPASASVQVQEEAILWSMNLENLRRYLAEHPGGGGALLVGMARCLSQRLRQTNYLIGQHHAVPEEMLPNGRERAITAENTPIQLGFFDRLKRSLHSEKKVRISKEIKL